MQRIEPSIDMDEVLKLDLPTEPSFENLKLKYLDLDDEYYNEKYGESND